MQFYYLDSSQNYLQTISSWLVNNYADSLDSLKIFLPSGICCQFLNRYLLEHLAQTSKNKDFFLPSMMPISAIAEDLMANKIKDALYLPASKNEKILALTQIIYQQGQLSMAEAFGMAGALSSILQDLWKQGVHLSNITLDSSLEQSIFLQQQLQYLLSYSGKLQHKLAMQQKLTSYEFCSEIFKSYAPEGNIIFIGLTRQSKDFYQFLSKFISQASAVFILPPIDSSQLPYLCNDSEEVLNLLNIQASEIKPLVSIPNSARLYLNDFIERPSSLESTAKPSLDHISVIESESEIEESNLILLIIKDFIDKNPQASVALLSPNHNIAKLVINNLEQHQIPVANFIGQSFENSKLAQFIICLAELLMYPCDMEKLLICIKHPFVVGQNSIKIECFIRENKFINNPEQIDAYVQKCDNINLQNWWQNFYQALKNAWNLLQDVNQSFAFLLKTNLQTAEQICPDIWRLNNRSGIHFLRELLEASGYITIINKDQYAPLIKEIFKKTKITDSQQIKQISLLPVESSQYLNFDLIILSDMNENSWPNLSNNEMWMTNNLRKTLHLSTKDDELNCKIYDFYLMLCNKQVIMTRSRKVNNRQTSPSKFLQKLFVLESKYKTHKLKNKDHYLHYSRQHFNLRSDSALGDEFLIPGSSFPAKVSATNIELLIRNPYGFFAKNILKLYPLNEINLDSMNAEFGKLLHKIISIYNKQDDKNRQMFLNIADKELKNLSDNEFIIKMWWPKICSIAKPYVEFEQKRRLNIKQICSEIYGEIYLNFDDRQIKIIAIADEIIINKDNTAQILDYKTGAIPSLKDVLSGLSPQLIIEGLILQQGGFKSIPSITPNKVTFVKLASLEPYIVETSIDSIDFAKHCYGLKELIGHYIKGQVSYLVTPSLDYAPKYDNYKHLGRKKQNS
jgi:ATP-dependent helicase/nuclease subunit B